MAPTPPRPVEDLAALARGVESALAREEVAAACQMLSQTRPSPGGPLDPGLAARAYTLQARQRWDKPSRAIPSLERALEWQPENPHLHRLHAALLRRSGSSKRAVAPLMEASRLAPEDPRIAYEALLTRLAAGDGGADLRDLATRLDGREAHRAAALIEAMAGNLASAERSAAASDHPMDRLIRAVLLLARGGADAAIPLLEEVATGDLLPRIAVGYACLYLGIARMQLRQLAPAAEALERARELGVPESQLQARLAWVYQQLAIGAVLEGDLAAATEWFGRLAGLGGPEAEEARGNTAYALALHGQVRAREGNWEAAASLWSRALAITPGDMALRQNLAIALERAGRGDEAIPLWHELVRQMPRGAEDRTGEAAELRRHIRAAAHGHLADLYLEGDEVGRAIDELERAVRIVPDDVDTRRNLASLLLDEGQARKAATHYRQVVAALPNSAEDRLEYALALQAAGDEAHGIEEMERTLELQPDNPAARSSLGLALAERVSLSPGAVAALEDAHRAVELLPPEQVGLGLIALGAAQLAREDQKEAKKSFKQAVKVAPSKAIAAVRVGEAYWRAGHSDAATAAWTDAAKRAKRSPYAYALLAEAWAMAADTERCKESLKKLIERPEGWLWALEAVETVSRSRKLQPLLREVLRSLAGDADSPTARVFLVRMLIHAGDMQTAGSLLNRAAIDAVEQGDSFVLEVILTLDLRYRLIDRRTTRVVADYLGTHGYGEEMAL